MCDPEKLIIKLFSLFSESCNGWASISNGAKQLNDATYAGFED